MPDSATAGTRIAALLLLWRASRPLTLTAGVLLVADAVLPSLTLIAMGRATGRIPAAVTDGLGSPAGHGLVLALGLAAGCFALSMLRGPVQDVVSAAARARLTASLQGRLVRAVSAPPGIAHLEDPRVLDQLAGAQGEIMGDRPSDAPMTLFQLAGSRLGGLVACGVLSGYRWWLGLMLLAVWLVVRVPLRALVRARAATYRAAGPPLRRAWYFLGVAWRPQFGKEVRVFGLGDWVVDSWQRLYTDAMSPSWRTIRRLNARVAAAGVLVLGAYGLGAGTLAWDAYHHTAGLRTLATLLPMLPATMPVGSVTLQDFQLESMLRTLPDLAALEAGLAPSPAGAPPGAAGGVNAAGTVPDVPAPAPARARAVDRAGAPPGDRPVAQPGDLSKSPPDDRPMAPSGDRPVPPPARDTAGLPRQGIRFESVGFRYPGGGHDVLAGLDLELPAGSSLALVGVNGAGKTTLVTLLARLREPTAGRITVDGTDLASLDPADWQRQLAVVFQDFTRYPFTAAENVSLALHEPPDRQALERAAERAGAAELVAALPHGWETVLSPHYTDGTDLSGGQWQRLALTRALYAVERGARVLVLDEPTAQLDVRAEAAFYDRFLEITGGTTAIVISHRFSTVRRADRIAVLDGGLITELGSHEELLDRGGQYAELFRAQAARFTAGGTRHTGGRA
ncbi:ABC transporter ATP-binding protein [Streptomyces sp. TS71-3]|uniref:ABC transporter ATP-binding protein n=1 Tax=Streptomyces sp. TS71-3 TaxID=2733862 RepID=UPI001B2C788A|nr:ATP-binding cassette domain-containing protein [Streptomyces sp. TS71-3]GHJ41646.1 hypothetical protein Sm713_72550 [Streptomyces sp. TS71-3]